jgi:ion channel
MTIAAGVASVVLIFVVLWDAFETVVLPRRVTRRLRLARLVLANLWTCWMAVTRRIRRRGRREMYLGYFGPLTVIVLLVTWAAGLIVGFAGLQWAFGSRLVGPEGTARFGTDVYMSGTTFFTLGLGDVVPRSTAARALVVVEAGLGFGFLAMVIAYLPVLYQAFSRREVRIALLDAWAGSPPAAAELIRRLGPDGRGSLLGPFLQDWELWAAELLETHISYPALAFFRSQHDNQSWVAALTTVLDACALAIAVVEGAPVRAASLTFAMARHAVVDLSFVLNTPPRAPEADRLPAADLTRLLALLREAGVAVRDDPASTARLAELRAAYEPYVTALSRRLLMDLPAWTAAQGAKDNWQKTAWR